MGVQERLSLETVSSEMLIASEHVHRYQLAAQLCQGMRVVDLACGTGYGSAILQETAESVLGVDNDVATIDMANATVGAEHDVSFEVADALEFLARPLGEDYDAIVCFEGLEHFEHPEPVLDQLAQHAAAGIKIIVSVPNSKGLGEENEFHVTDYGYEEFLAAFERFGEIKVLFQFLAEGSLLTADDNAESSSAVILDSHAEREWANHFIACVNLDEAVSNIEPDSRLRLVAAAQYNRHIRNLERANRELWRENARMAETRMGVRDSAAVVLHERLHDAYLHCELLQARLDTPEHRVVELMRQRLSRRPRLERVVRRLAGRRRS